MGNPLIRDYGLVNDEPAVLASFPTGDRAQGGYLDACIRDQVLLIVRERGTAAACADFLENASYSWRNDRFEQLSSELQPLVWTDSDCDPYWEQCVTHDYSCRAGELLTVCGNRPYEDSERLRTAPNPSLQRTTQARSRLWCR